MEAAPDEPVALQTLTHVVAAGNLPTAECIAEEEALGMDFQRDLAKDGLGPGSCARAGEAAPALVTVQQLLGSSPQVPAVEGLHERLWGYWGT